MIRFGPFTIRYDERICIFGRAGSGKTTLARVLLEQADTFVAIDPKHSFYCADATIRSNYSRFYKRQIIRLDEDDYDDYDRVSAEIRKRHNLVYYIDELNDLTPTRRLPKNLQRLIKYGREPKQAVWTVSQRPMDIPSSVFTEANHFFVFRLINGPDMEKVRKFAGDETYEKLINVRGHEFVYYNVDKDYSKTYKLRLGVTHAIGS